MEPIEEEKKSSYDTEESSINEIKDRLEFLLFNNRKKMTKVDTLTRE